MKVGERWRLDHIGVRDLITVGAKMKIAAYEAEARVQEVRRDARIAYAAAVEHVGGVGGVNLEHLFISVVSPRPPERMVGWREPRAIFVAARTSHARILFPVHLKSAGRARPRWRRSIDDDAGAAQCSISSTTRAEDAMDV